MPGLTIIRPADANEPVEAWRAAMRDTEGPVGLVLSRQKLPVLDRTRFAAASGLARGAYVLAEAEGGPPRLVLIASGSEVSLAVQARERLQAEGTATRVVSMPSWELFARQTQDYRDSVLPPAVPARLAIEAGSSLGWKRWVGDGGDSVSVDRFGASAPGETVLQQLGFSVDHIVRRARALLS
jgi:transketolase